VRATGASDFIISFFLEKLVVSAFTKGKPSSFQGDGGERNEQGDHPRIPYKLSGCRLAAVDHPRGQPLSRVMNTERAAACLSGEWSDTVAAT
jgi:hypothetical protein